MMLGQGTDAVRTFLGVTNASSSSANALLLRGEVNSMLSDMITV